MAVKWTPKSELAKVVYAAGFEYNPDQDIIFSRMNAWQRYFGYAYAYDVAAPVTISALIDCEPFFFRYKKMDWMIELWKGQYGLETGAEIGVYICKQPYLNPILGSRPHDSVNAKFFDCVGNRRSLKMSFTLYRNGAALFSRGPVKHWWLTGFKWGVLSRSEELTMDLCITFPTAAMCMAFVSALKKAGYQNINIDSKTVSFIFDKPSSFQPRLDPRCENYVKTADENNSKIVKHYSGLNLQNNDCNQIPENISDEIINYFNSYDQEFLKNHLSEVLKESGHPVKGIIEDLEAVFRHNQNTAGKILRRLTNFMKIIFG